MVDLRLYVLHLLRSTGFGEHEVLRGVRNAARQRGAYSSRRRFLGRRRNDRAACCAPPFFPSLFAENAS
jgi:hypothetical protein